MNDQRESYTSVLFLLLVLSGIASVLVSAFGLFAFAWADDPSIVSRLFWILPVMSLPAFGLYFFNRKIGLLCSWLISIGLYVTLLVINWQSCIAGHCTTTNPVMIALGALVGAPPLWGQILASTFLQLASAGTQALRQLDDETGGSIVQHNEHN